MKSFNFKRFIISFLLCHAAGLIGSIFTVSAIPMWYEMLQKPALSPPNWIFGPVWLLLYTLMAFAFYFIWENGLSKKNKFIFYFFLVHLALNSSWSILFFGMRNPLLGLINIILILIMILVLMFKFYDIKKISSYLLIPYFLWVAFATYLNFAIWLLNF